MQAPVRFTLLTGYMLSLVFTYLLSPMALAQTDSQRRQNLSTCLSGRYPTLCRREWLSSDERRSADIAERQQNLQTCLTGRYPALCKKSLLSPEEHQQVVAAEKRENLTTCLTGRYKALCKKNLLTDSELRQVVAAERANNLQTCLLGRYPALCDKSQLSSDELSRVQAAEQKANQARPQIGSSPQRATPSRAGRSGCEDGLWIDSVSNDGEIVKLSDGSIWQVDAVDAIDSMLWLPVSDIVACSNRLINTDDNETVSARRLR